jgi:CBS domain-containing protein
MQVQDLMAQPAITCHVNDGLDAAAQKMWDHDCGALPVVNDEGKVTGVITDRDICMAALTQGRALHELLVNVAMAKTVTAIGPHDSLEEAEHRMAKHQVRRLPVVDAAYRPIGVLSLNDLAIAATRPDARRKPGHAAVAQTLAAVCQPRTGASHAA